MNAAIYPGSFDPVTLGHLDIIKRASKIFDKLIVAVLNNKQKACVFPVEQRVEFLKRCVADLPNVEIGLSGGLLVDYASKMGVNVIVKGLRAISDFESEFQQALINRKMVHDLDTVFLTTSYKYLYLSSSVVREIGSLGGNISDFIPSEIYSDVCDKLKEGVI